jgi:hypothetical protein
MFSFDKTFMLITLIKNTIYETFYLLNIIFLLMFVLLTLMIMNFYYLILYLLSLQLLKNLQFLNLMLTYQ